MRWPSVGVVIPTRNRPEMLDRAIAAVEAQDYPGEVRTVVVFDQATPDYMLARAGDRPVMVLVNCRTPGLAGARNTGILNLSTDLVAFCDDDDVWSPKKLRRQVRFLGTGEFATCAMNVRFDGISTPRLAGMGRVGVPELVRSRMAMLHASSFLIRRAVLGEEGALGLVAEDAPGSQNEDWDLLLRAAKRAPVRHLDEPLIEVAWGRTSFFAHQYDTKISSLRWMMERHPEIGLDGVGAGRVYGQLACWSAARGDRSGAVHWVRQAVRSNWREPRAAIALAALSGAVRVETVLGALHKRGRGI
ncbi:glycosyltransferase family 2 protein [Virgisporangium aurantiacum]|nr:glycosyltransferase family 2 protein [Virgisporangium aurantiacum]